MHRIRLHGFWTVTALDGGRVRHSRRFGRPRALDPGETAWLVCERVPGPGTVHLNGEPVGEFVAGEPFAFDVTARLQPRNEVCVEIAAPGDAPLGEVALEIRGERHP
jgi:hypothetical protein